MSNFTEHFGIRRKYHTNGYDKVKCFSQKCIYIKKNILNSENDPWKWH